MANSSLSADKVNHRPVVLITGASSGLGAGMAKLFAQNGSDLALCARRTEKLEALKAEILAIAPNTRIELAPLDVTDYAAVFDVFREFRTAFGVIDRVIVNAGVGTGYPIGRGGFKGNLSVANTNFTAAIAQSEAAMEIFRDQSERGHLVFISSMSAMRGLRGSMTSYAASKAGIAHFAEGLHADMMRKPNIRISRIFPGYIESEINDGLPKKATPFIISNDKGCRLLVKAIEAEKVKAYVPAWPWLPLSIMMKILPISVVTKMF